jgi:hypothetical protein
VLVWEQLLYATDEPRIQTPATGLELPTLGERSILEPLDAIASAASVPNAGGLQVPPCGVASRPSVPIAMEEHHGPECLRGLSVRLELQHFRLTVGDGCDRGVCRPEIDAVGDGAHQLAGFW